MILKMSNSEYLSKHLRIFSMSEPHPDYQYLMHSIYIGKTAIYKTPFFLDLNSAVNPHLVAVGMSGSGKTFFLKSLMIKENIINGSNVLVVDWSGEYLEAAKFVSGAVYKFGGEDGLNIIHLLCKKSEGINGLANLISKLIKADATEFKLIGSLLETYKNKFNGNFSIKELINEVKKSEGGQLYYKLSMLHESGLFDGKMRVNLYDFFKGFNDINLSTLNGSIKLALADIIFKSMMELMPDFGISNSIKNIIVVDEAWKIINPMQDIGKLFRESRKYGFAIFIATQLIEDINNEIISNSAHIAIFKLRNQADYDIIRGVRLFSEYDISRMNALRVGSCFMSVLTKNSGSKSFLISHIDGLQVEFFEIKGEIMNYPINLQKFSEYLEGIGIARIEINRIMEHITESDKILELEKIISILSNSGLSRADILVSLRLFGIPDIEIVKAYNRLKKVHFNVL